MRWFFSAAGFNFEYYSTYPSGAWGRPVSLVLPDLPSRICGGKVKITLSCPILIPEK